MACMTHTCLDCGSVTCDNNARSKCPVCGGCCLHLFDEIEDDPKDEEETDVSI